MGLTRLLIPFVCLGIGSACISQPIKDNNQYLIKPEFIGFKVYPQEGLVTKKSDTNKDGKWDLKEYYQIITIGEDGEALMQLCAKQEDTNGNGTFEIYEFTWPKGMREKVEKSLEEATNRIISEDKGEYY